MKRYSAPILPYLAEKLTERGIYHIFAEAHTCTSAQNYAHACGTSAHGYTGTHVHSRAAAPPFELIDLLLLKDSICECANKLGFIISSATIWSAC